MARRDPLERTLYEQVRIYGCSEACPDSWRVGFNGGVPVDPEDIECPGCGVPGYDVEAAARKFTAAAIVAAERTDGR
jgi:hypothetical protein